MTMTYSFHIFMPTLLFLCIWCTSCDRRDFIQGQSNGDIVFCAIVVDQDGKPLAGAIISYDVEYVPKGYKLGDGFAQTTVSVVSDLGGKIEFAASGKYLFLNQATKVGYLHLDDKNPADPPIGTGKRAYWFHQEGRDVAKFDWENPAVFVFIKEGETDVHVVPSSGGYYAIGKQWRRVKPAWPNEPSIPGVRYVAPATQPAK